MIQFEKPENFAKQFLMELLSDTELICSLCHRFEQLSGMNGIGTERRCLLKVLCNHCGTARECGTEIVDIESEPTLEASELLLE